MRWQHGWRSKGKDSYLLGDLVAEHGEDALGADEELAGEGEGTNPNDGGDINAGKRRDNLACGAEQGLSGHVCECPGQPAAIDLGVPRHGDPNDEERSAQVQRWAKHALHQRCLLLRCQPRSRTSLTQRAGATAPPPSNSSAPTHRSPRHGALDNPECIECAEWMHAFELTNGNV